MSQHWACNARKLCTRVAFFRRPSPFSATIQATHPQWAFVFSTWAPTKKVLWVSCKLAVQLLFALCTLCKQLLNFFANGRGGVTTEV